MAEQWRWTGEVIQGNLRGCRVEVRAHGFPMEMYLLGVGRDLGSSSTFVISMAGLSGLSQRLRGLGLSVVWDNGASPFDEEARPARGRRCRTSAPISQRFRLRAPDPETVSGDLRRITGKTF